MILAGVNAGHGALQGAAPAQRLVVGHACNVQPSMDLSTHICVSMSQQETWCLNSWTLVLWAQLYYASQDDEAEGQEQGSPSAFSSPEVGTSVAI